MFYSSGGVDPVGQLPDDLGVTLNNDDLQAVVVVKMDVLGGKNVFVVIMLKVDQTIDQLSLMMIINIGDGSHHFSAANFPFPFDQLLPDEISDGLGSIGIVPFGNVAIKGLNELRGNRDSEAIDLSHVKTPTNPDFDRAANLAPPL